ncbi:PAS domain-containing sensor histidine kinase [Romboutsia sp.]|uniref:PAS domain-containing sensor histidine kinase n=1 Tax=Romboutsia sp. TaxID=1965302 RepID=UPI003F2F79B7
MLDKGEYIKILLESPIPCMWAELQEDKNEKVYYINILGANEKLKEISKNIIKENISYKISSKKYDYLINVVKNSKQAKKDSIVELVKFEEAFYKLDINHISEDKYMFWYTEKIDTVREKGIISSGISDTKMLELISDTIPDSIFFKDINGVFRHCNKVFAENRNLTKEDVIGKVEKDINTPDIKIKKYQLEEEEIIKSKKTSINNSTLLCKDGRVKYLETIKVPLIDEHKTVAGVLGIARDISHRKEAEEEFERLRMEFFANLSHEFKTPLNLIFSSIQLIEFMIDRDKNNKKYRMYTNIIKQNGYRLLKIVNNLIDSTRLSSGCLEYNPQNYNMVEFIENICDSVQYYAQQESITLIFDTNLEEKVMAFDLEKMERIILNLLSNAIKYNRERGKIEVKLNFEEEYLHIKVRDSGVGIPKDKLNDVFKLFKQINNRITKLSEGSGIGLSIVKSLVDLHDGSIKVYSAEGVGSEFLIKIPIDLCTKEKDEKIPVKYNRYVETIDIEFSDIYSIIK